MADARAQKLAKLIVEYSCAVKPGEKILIEMFGPSTDLGKEIVKATYQAGGMPFVHIREQRVWRDWLMEITEEQLHIASEVDRALMEKMDCYVGLRGSENINEYADVPSDKLALFDTFYGTPVHSEARVKGTRWCVLRYPNASMAQLANMSVEAFEDFYYQVCTLDYSRMKVAMNSLKQLMEQTDKVHIVGPGATDLRFSIKGIPAVPCAGELNIPDGEVFTAPVRESVNGVIEFNTPSPYRGYVFENIRLTFENGKIIKAEANDTKRINHIFDADEGARYVGEFSFGLNPYIKEPMKDILFDEKIDGSFHFTPGNCYDEAYNGNHSSIHWDLVCIQRPEYGGGEIYFDDRLIRKDGRFVIPELDQLNPEHLQS